MAYTAEQLMNRSLKQLIVAGSESSVSAADAGDFIVALNAFVDELESKSGVDLTWTTVTSIGDTLTSPGSVFRALAALMAIEMAPEYGATVAPETIYQAKQGLDTIYRVCTTKTAQSFPATLPLGSGNEDDGANYGDGNFY